MTGTRDVAHSWLFEASRREDTVMNKDIHLRLGVNVRSTQLQSRSHQLTSPYQRELSYSIVAPSLSCPIID